MSSMEHLFDSAIDLLKNLISTPSFSGNEDQTANLIEKHLQLNGRVASRKLNNVWSVSDNCQKDAPVILLNSHHDTVKEAENWKYHPFKPVIDNGNIYGLGSNDAGASVVSLLTAFLHLANKPSLPYRLVIALTAEEETSGPGGISSILDDLGHIDLAIVGEPTEMQMAIAEKGLVVLDCVSHGKAGHAARDEGLNAIYCALEDIEFIRNHSFPRISEILGPVKLTVTQINAGHQHNVVPACCEFVVDVRTNELYSNKEVVALLSEHLRSQIKPRSLRLNSSGIPMDHPIVKRGMEMGLSCFGSPTLSDQALLPYTSVKIGPGSSSRSHIADEYVTLEEIKKGIDTYIKLLTNLNLS